MVAKNATLRPLVSANTPHVGAPNIIPTNTTLVRLPSWRGVTPRQGRSLTHHHHL